jgi:hypothetical protein
MAQTRRQISGIDILLQIDPMGGTNFDLIVCLTSNSLERTTTVIDAASKCGPEKLPGVQSIQVPFAFNDVLDVNTGEISESDLHTLWVNKTVFSFKYGKLAPLAGDVSYTGTGFLSDLKSAAAQNAAASTTGTIEVQGNVTQVKTAS